MGDNLVEKARIATPVRAKPNGAAFREPAVVAVRRRATLRALLVASAVLVFASAAVQFSAYVLDHGDLLGLTDLLDMRDEGNLPAWFSSLVTLACGCLVAMRWVVAKRSGEVSAIYWAALFLLFVAASADEVASIHEAVGKQLSRATGGPNGHVFLYLIPGTLLLLGVAAGLRGFFSRLEERFRRAFLLGAAIWAVGAIALEVIEAVVQPPPGAESGLGLALLNTSQDAFELLGMIIMLSALARYMSDGRYQLTLSFPHREPA